MPQEMSARTGEIAVELAFILANHLDLISRFIPTKEFFHLQMNLLYVLVDVMQATKNTNVEHILDNIRDYFKSLEREKHDS